MGAYRCREHPECEVTWRGTGCVECAAEAEQARLEAGWWR